MNYSAEEIQHFLSEIPDPEIPVITISELGVLREVTLENGKVFVSITPTYTGCPAMKAFEDDISSKLREKGVVNFEIKVVNSPAWTTAWMSDATREKLKRYGIAPPIKNSEDKGLLFGSGPKVVPCPQCSSTDTELKSQFSSTACKALYQCNSCLEPFEYFKCI